jgi:hypothetical protein
MMPRTDDASGDLECLMWVDPSKCLERRKVYRCVPDTTAVSLETSLAGQSVLGHNVAIAGCSLVQSDGAQTMITVGQGGIYDYSTIQAGINAAGAGGP